MIRSSSQRTRSRPAFTFVELLIAASITAMTLAAGATMVSAVSNAVNDTKDTRAVRKSGQLTVDRACSLVRQARGIGQVKEKVAVFWDVDLNRDDIVNMYETSMLVYKSDTFALVWRKPVPPSAGSSGAVVADNIFTDAQKMGTLYTGLTIREVTIAVGVQGFLFAGFPDTTQTRIVNFAFWLNSAGGAMLFRGSASPRASADYLFDSKTQEANETAGEPIRRTEFSRWTGWADVDGKSVVYP